MSSCIGFLGKLFGHNFKEYLIASSPTGGFEASGVTVTDSKMIEISESFKIKKYSIICKRCGEKKEMNDVK
jgi:hypothetical protein